MSAFDPYHKWLGIPAAEQPPNHYRLLGIAVYETDLEVIESAADRQMSYIRQCATGPYVKESQQILNELSAARLCLLNAAKKHEYDNELRVLVAPPAERRVVSKVSLTRIPASRPEVDETQDDEFAMLLPTRTIAPRSAALSRRKTAKKTSLTNAYILWGGADGLGLILLCGAVYLGSQSAKEPPQPVAQTVIANSESVGKEGGAANQSEDKDSPGAEVILPLVASEQTSPAVSPPPSVTPPVELAPPEIVPRAVIERILELKGNLTLRSESKKQVVIKSLRDLPEGDFTIDYLSLGDVTLLDLQRICTIPIKILWMSAATQLTDGHLAILPSAIGIRELHICQALFTDSGLAHLARVRDLSGVYLNGTTFTPEGWKHLRQIPELDGLRIDGGTVSDAHLGALAGHPKLKVIQLSHCGVTGEGFLAIRGMPQLETVGLTRAPVTPSGLRAIGEALPELQQLLLTSSTSPPGITDAV